VRSTEAAESLANARPLASVVIPFGSGIAELNEQLAALYSQQFDEDWEIVVSCNAGIPSSAGILPAPDIPNLILRCVDSSDRRGPSHARNVGWRNGTADAVLFCDADDVVDTNWVASMMRTLESYDFVRGRVEYARLNQNGISLYDPSENAPHPTKFHHLPFGASCALGFHKYVLEKLGGFDESLRSGEDVDLCWRAQYEGYTFGFASGALLHYRLRTKASTLFKQSILYGKGDVALFIKHRNRGAYRSFGDTCFELAAIGYFAVRAVSLRSGYRTKLALRLGYLVGHLIGFVKSRHWVV
jgi:GT2 family glycosyltransferase